MEEEYQKDEALKDIMVKNDRIKILENTNAEIQKKLLLSMTVIEATISERSWKVCEKGLKEILEA